jgi:hypothetical protein
LAGRVEHVVNTGVAQVVRDGGELAGCTVDIDMEGISAGAPARLATVGRGPSGTGAVAVGTVARRWEELEHRG